ncbi:MAG: ROK family protein [Oscillospiraceae bacterium]|nr:ROK family protein [Oscillospiraceae bacterium]
MKKYLVFDIGGTFIKYAMMNEQNTMLEQNKVASPVDSLELLLGALEEIGKQFAGQYEGIAVSMPGRIDTQSGIAYTGGAFAFIRNIPMATLIAERLGVPVTIANDGKCAANAERNSGALAGVADGAVIVLGTGTGGGIVLDGKVRMGHTFAAGELSVLPTDFVNVSRGIEGLESDNMDSIWANAMSATGLLWRYAVRKGLPKVGHGIDGFAFFKAYDAGEPEAIEALTDFAGQAAAGIYAVQSVLDLQRFAIGGGISARSEVTDAIRQAVDGQFAAIPFTPFGKPEIVRCKYGNDANLIGALRFHLDYVGRQ